MRQHNLLGRNILGSGFSFDIEIREGAGAYVCGEETALIASIEGDRGIPHPRPPFPSQAGLWGKPTVVNNVETWANIPVILEKGAGWFARYGTDQSKGTKTFALAGNICNTGLVEVPMGATLRNVIYDIGGGIPNGKAFKAVQTGGPSGGCLPAGMLDMPIDFNSLTAAGSIMGSGGMVVMDEDTCMVDVARYFIDFTRKESCGQCLPCRLGTRQMFDIINDITRGRGRPEDIDTLIELSEAVKHASLLRAGTECSQSGTYTPSVFSGMNMKPIFNESVVRAGVCRELAEGRACRWIRFAFQLTMHVNVGGVSAMVSVHS
jgi:NADH:ubiquinone oxidoreductase subunit F (NADH-binding)